MTSPAGTRPAAASRLDDVLIWAGTLILLAGGLLWGRGALAAAQVGVYRYLPAGLPQPLPLPLPLPAGVGHAAALEPDASADGAVSATGVEAALPPVAQAAAPPLAAPAGVPRPTLEVGLLAPTVMAQPTLVPATPAPTPTAPPETAPGPAEAPPAAESTGVEAALPPYSPVVRLLIPSLEIDRAVAPVGLRPAASGSLEWDTDSLFATRNRPDLVGQLVGSYSPGQGGNILLVGHNSNRLDFGRKAVFADLKSLHPGDRIELFTEDGRSAAYQVELVKQVPWRTQDEAELEKHMKYMGPTPAERLTLITCGGANLWPFPARVYVTAVPVAQ